MTQTLEEKRAAAAAYSRKWRAENPELAKASRLRSYYKHHEAGKARSKKWYKANREKSNASRKAWYERNPGSVRCHNLRKYGLTQGQWDEMFAAQGFACAACGNEEPGAKNWHTDHNHATGEIRGILCCGCNLAIGMAKDDPKTLRALAEYLEKQAAA